MTGSLWLWRPGGPTAADREALARGGARRGDGTAPAAWGSEGVAWGLPPGAPARAGQGPCVARGTDDPAHYLACVAGAVLGGSRLDALLATGLLPRTLDAPGLAGWLWRGGALDARLPIRDVRAVPAGGSARAGVGNIAVERPGAGADPGGSSDWFARLVEVVAREGSPPVLTHGGHASLVLLLAAREASGREPESVTIRWTRTPGERVAEAGRSAASVGARHRVVDATGFDVEPSLRRYLATADLPTTAGFLAAVAQDVLARDGVPRALASPGGDALFATEGFARRTRPAPRDLLDRSRRPRGHVDALDVVAQAERERRAYRRVPVNAAHAALATMPAATRQALLVWGAHPPDPLRPRHPGLVAAACELAVRSVYPDLYLREGPNALGFPYLDAEVVRRALATAPAERMGRPGSAGLLARRVRAARGWATRRRAPGPAAALEGWLRGPLDGWLDATLRASALVPGGAWRPEAVERALRDWRRGALGGLDATNLLVLGLAAAWLARERVGRAER